MNFWQEEQCEKIISRAKLKAGANGSNMNLANILTNMVIEIGEVFGYDVRDNIPSDLKAEIYASTAGSAINRLLTGWIPGVGKAVNHVSASVMPDDVGKHAIQYFDSLKQNDDWSEAIDALEKLSALFDNIDNDDDDDYYW